MIRVLPLHGRGAVPHRRAVQLTQITQRGSARHCGSSHVGWLPNQNRWQCGTKHPKRQFSVKVGTIFEDSPIGLDKWLPAVWLIVNCKNGISSYQLARDLE